MSNCQNYLVNVSCPHCSSKLVVAISGFGGELAVRTKECKKCGKEFYVNLLSTTSTTEEITDGTIAVLKDRINRLRQDRKRTHGELLLRYESAMILHREALVMAREMRSNNESN